MSERNTCHPSLRSLAGRMMTWGAGMGGVQRSVAEDVSYRRWRSVDLSPAVRWGRPTRDRFERSMAAELDSAVFAHPACQQSVPRGPQTTASLAHAELSAFRKTHGNVAANPAKALA